MTTHQTPTYDIELLDQFESPYITLSLEDGMLCCRYADDLHVSLEVAKSSVEAESSFRRA